MIRVTNNRTLEVIEHADNRAFKTLFWWAMQFAIEIAQAHDRDWVKIEVDGEIKYYLVPTLYRVGNSSPTSASIDLIRVGKDFHGPIRWISKL